MKAPRITLKIDRIVADQPGLTRRALERELHGALAAHFEAHGVEGFGAGSHRAVARGSVDAGQGASPVSVAQAAVKAVTS